MVDTPDEIQRDLDNNRYKWQDYDISKQISYAIGHKLRHVTVEYHVCPKLQEELKSKGYNVRITDNWFFGERTTITW